MNFPKLSCCNFIPQSETLKQFALDHGLSGVEWSFTSVNLPQTQREENDLIDTISSLYPLEVRYHCALHKIDLGNTDLIKSQKALKILYNMVSLVDKLGGKFLTIHIGLGHHSTNDFSLNRTIKEVTDLVKFAHNKGVNLCLENLAWGWTSRPNLFEKFIRKSGALVTLDIGHARVCNAIKMQHYYLEDFVSPHPQKVVSAHIYHEECERGHMPPQNLKDIEDRLCLLKKIGCDWWVLELHEKSAFLLTLKCVREFLDAWENQGIS